MILTVRRIELVNWMAHRQETIEFPDTGVFLLWGTSGAGKSSLLESIAFALAGHTATRAQRLDELKHELYPEEDLQVRLTLGLGDGREVQIFRGTDKGRSTVWMVDHDGTLLEGNAAVKERVAGLLGGMDGPTLFATYYSQQGELDALVKMAGGGRRQFVQRMLGVSALDNVIKTVKKTITGAQERIGLIDDTLPTETVEELGALRASLKQEERLNLELRQSIDVELEAIEIRGKQLRESLDKSKADWERLRTLTPQIRLWREQELPNSTAETERLTARIAEAAQASERLRARPDRERIDALQREAETLSAAEGALRVLAERTAEAESASAALESAEAELATHRVTPVPEGEDPAALSNHRAELRSEYRSIKATVDELPAADDLGDECYACLRPFDDASRAHVHASVRERREKLTARLDQLAEAGSSFEARIAEAERVQRERGAHEQAETRLAQTVEHRTATRDTARLALDDAGQSAERADADRLRTIRSELAELSAAVATLEHDERLAGIGETLQQELEMANGKRDDLQRRLTEAEAELIAIDIDEDARTEQERTYEQIRSRYVELTRQRGDSLAEAQRIVGALDVVESGIARHQQLAEDRKEASERAVTYGRVERSIREFRQYLIGTIRPMLEDLTSAHLSELTDGVMPAVSINEDYDMSIKRHGEFRRIGLCSGGEQARAAFSLRLALTQLVSQRTDTPVGFMVFDEIFGSQDEEHRKAFLDSLVHLRGIYPQVFLISHEETLKDSPLVSMILSVPDAESTNRITVENR